VKEVREAKTQKQVWEVINKERRRKVKVNKEIGMEEWDSYFRRMLGGSEFRVRREIKRTGEKEGVEGEEGEEEIKFEEVDRAIRKLKKGKTAGEDGIQNEVWLWRGEGLRRALRGICSRVWSGGRYPEG